MATVNMVKTIKKIYPFCILLVKIGNFYNVYRKDAYILSYLFEYKIVEKEGVPTCGFTINAISKVENILEESIKNQGIKNVILLDFFLQSIYLKCYDSMV